MAEISFWKERMRKYGHTGWCYPCTYGFDQPLRVKIVKKLVECFASHREMLLDFGCGTGDFSHALKDDFKQIIVYDPCVDALEKAVRKFNGLNNITPVSEFSDLVRINKSYDMILSITVLQHVMSDNELHDVLQFLYQNVNQGGVFIVLESFSSHITSEYERNWTYADFQNEMEQVGFLLVKGYDFYNPLENDEKFNQYFTLPEVVQLRKNKGMSDQEKIVEYQRISSKYTENPDDFLSPITKNDGSKYLIYRKDQ